jgi:hypothetical protein
LATRTSKPKLRGSDFTQHGSLTIYRQGDKRTDIDEGIESSILVRLENSGHGTALGAQLCQEICCHRLAVDHKVVQMRRFSHLLVGYEHLGNALSQMQIAAMGGGKQGMSLFIVQQHQCTATGNLAEPSNQAARNQGLGVDRLAVPIHVKRGGGFSAPFLYLPHNGCPPRQGFGQCLIGLDGRKLQQEAFGMAITVGVWSARQYG